MRPATSNIYRALYQTWHVQGTSGHPGWPLPLMASMTSWSLSLVVTCPCRDRCPQTRSQMGPQKAKTEPNGLWKDQTWPNLRYSSLDFQCIVIRCDKQSYHLTLIRLIQTLNHSEFPDFKHRHLDLPDLARHRRLGGSLNLDAVIDHLELRQDTRQEARCRAPLDFPGSRHATAGVGGIFSPKTWKYQEISRGIWTNKHGEDSWRFTNHWQELHQLYWFQVHCIMLGLPEIPLKITWGLPLGLPATSVRKKQDSLPWRLRRIRGRWRSGRNDIVLPCRC